MITAWSTLSVKAAGMVVPAVWIGMLIGVSFIATPSKFAAPTLSLPTALDVGRHTFAIYNRVEWVALLLMLIVLASRFSTFGLALVAGLTVILVAQTIWLLPALDARTTAVLRGVPQPLSDHHRFYVGLEGLKLLLLLVSTWIAALTALRQRV